MSAHVKIITFDPTCLTEVDHAQKKLDALFQDFPDSEMHVVGSGAGKHWELEQRVTVVVIVRGTPKVASAAIY